MIDHIDTTAAPHERLMRAIGKWTEALRLYPGFVEWKRKTIGATMDHGDRIFGKFAREWPAETFPFPAHIERQHALVMSYLALSSSHAALADTEFYFRRFPFRGLPVSHEAHLRYICEFYFSRIYEFSERLKRCLNLANSVIAEPVNTGALVKLFTKDFKQELKQRNLIHHHERFDDIALDKIGLLGMMADTDKRNARHRGWDAEHRMAYRQACRQWSDRARRRGGRVEDYLNAVAAILEEQCGFLLEPVTATPPSQV